MESTWWLCLLHVTHLGPPQCCRTFPLPTSFWCSPPKPHKARAASLDANRPYSHLGCVYRSPARCVPAWCLGEEGISLLCPLLSSATTAVLKAKTFSFLFPVFFFFLIFRRRSFLLNCIEIILFSQRHQSPFLSRRPTFVQLLAPCLFIFSCRNQQEDRQALPPETEHSQGAGSHAQPRLHPQKHRVCQCRTARPCFTR